MDFREAGRLVWLEALGLEPWEDEQRVEAHGISSPEAQGASHGNARREPLRSAHCLEALHIDRGRIMDKVLVAKIGLEGGGTTI